MANHYATTHIRDSQDNGYYYRAGADYPREGLKVSDERLKELVNGGWIGKKEEPADLMKYKKDELLALAEEKGVEVLDSDTKADIIEKLGE